MKLHRTLATLLATAAILHANPSGLNNIPTADTTPQGTVVLQAYSTVGNDVATIGNSTDGDLTIGVKTGLDLWKFKTEFGFDSHLVPGKGGPVTFNGKLALPLGGYWPTLAVGAASNTFTNDDRARAGDTFAYFVASEDLHWMRIHAGIALQDSEPLPFFGLDKTFRIPVKQAADAKAVKHPNGKTTVPTEPAYRDLFTLRTDAIQQLDHDWLLSAGLLVPVCKFFVFEGWANFPTDGTKASFTLKANFVFNF